jgi:hypothetical protein
MFSLMVYRERQFTQKFLTTIQDLEACDALMIQCDSCRYIRRVAPHRLHDRFGDDTFITDVQRVMRCTRCGSSAVLWWVVRATPL